MRGFTPFQERVFWQLVTHGFTLGYQNDLLGVLAMDKQVNGRLVRVIICRDHVLVPKAGGGWAQVPKQVLGQAAAVGQVCS